MPNVWMVLLLVGFHAFFCSSRQLKVVSQWSAIDFNFPSEHLRRDAILRRQYIVGNAVPIDVDVHYKALASETRIFITLPRFKDGIPITLGTRSNKRSTDGSFLIDPYPDYTWHNLDSTPDCNNKMTSVFRIAIDECQRMWVMDTGKIGLSTAPQTCPPKILIFDLKSNQLIHRYQIPRNQYNEGTFFINPIIDVRDPPPSNCANSKAFIADVAGFSILVYDYRTDSSWRIRNKLMYPYPTYGTHTISGESFELMDGIFGMALMKNRNINGVDNRSLYFHALASDNENSVPVNLLDNRTLWEKDDSAEPYQFKIVGSKGAQSAAEAIDSNGNLYFGLNNQNAIACWNTKMPLSRSTVKSLVKNDDTLQFSAGMKVIQNSEGAEELWVLTNRFQKVFTGTLNNSEINFRIQAEKLSVLLKGTRCT